MASKGRTAARKTIRAQRRIALVQALFWPVTIVATLVVGATLVQRARASRRRNEPTDYLLHARDGAPAAPRPIGDPDAPRHGS